MFRRKTINTICIAFGVSVLLILAGRRLADMVDYYPSFESRMSFRSFWRNWDDSKVDISLQSLPINIYNGSSDINKILDITRNQIRLKSNEYFSYSGLYSLDDLVMESNGQPIRNVIISTWGSGATFLGEVLNAMPGTFYHYEPLLQYGNIQIRGPPHASGALNILKSMLKCDFKNLQEYFEYSKKNVHQFHHIPKLWDHFCRYKNELCYDLDFTGKICKLLPFQVMKVVRLRLRLIQEILQDSVVQRYEELALLLNITSVQLFNFFGIGITPEVQEFLHSQTTEEVPGVSPTSKVSNNFPFKWKTVLDFNYVEQIQSVCTEAMSLWGYRMAHNATHMASQDFYPLEPYTINP